MKDSKHAQSLRQSVAPILRALGASVMAEEAEGAATYIELLETQLETQLGTQNPRPVGPNGQNPPLSDATSRLSEEVKQLLREGHIHVPPKCPECNGTGHRYGQASRAQALRWSCSRCDGTGDSFASAPTKPPETT